MKFETPTIAVTPTFLPYYWKKNEDSFISIQDDVTLVINIHLLGHLISNESAYHHYYLVPVIPSV